ncbi:hypothetical protein KCP77_19725 [Salmonella enterica subsp. enterica]|nr:hypothetical protein KCP77_19725 [Salmonella enterica subsp. enterica]
MTVRTRARQATSRKMRSGIGGRRRRITPLPISPKMTVVMEITYTCVKAKMNSFG